MFDKQCKFCQAPFSAKDNRKVFCGSSCAAKHNNKRGVTGRQVKTVPKPCAGCGDKLPDKRWVYCSHPCRRSHVVAMWLAGELPTSDWSQLPDTVRNFLLDEAQNRCTRCEWSEVNPVTGRVPLEIDHINGDSLDHSRDNLKVLCPNCHSLTPTYRNIGNRSGRGRRRKADIQSSC